MKVRTKKCARAALLGIIMLFTCALTGIVAFADEQTDAPVATEVADKDWSLQGGDAPPPTTPKRDFPPFTISRRGDTEWLIITRLSSTV